MSQALLEQLQSAQQLLDPQFKALRNATGALSQAIKLAAQEQMDALAMQKALGKLRQAGEALANPELQAAIDAFAAETQTALDALAYAFAHDLKATFERRG